MEIKHSEPMNHVVKIDQKLGTSDLVLDDIGKEKLVSIVATSF